MKRKEGKNGKGTGKRHQEQMDPRIILTGLTVIRQLSINRINWAPTFQLRLSEGEAEGNCI